MKPDINSVGGLMRTKGYVGQPSRLTEVVIDSLVSSDATAIQFGTLVGRDPANARCLRNAHDTDELLGLVVRDATPFPADASGNVAYTQYRAVPFMKLGYLNAFPAEAVNAGDGVVAIFDGSSHLFTGLGSTVGGVNGTTRRLLRGHKWETTTPAFVTDTGQDPGEISVGFSSMVNYIAY
jgi:hypothetical protein